MVRAFASGGISFRGQLPQIRAAGGAGVQWAEEGAGPWEAFISGHPAKRKRSRFILEDVAARLGGYVSWGSRYADGGVHTPRYAATSYTAPPRYAATSYTAPPRVTTNQAVVSLDTGAIREAMRDAIDGSTLRLGSIDPITHQVKAQLVTEIRRA